jgi:hypothetical protein
MHSGRFGSRIFEMLLYKRRLLLTEVLSCSMQDVLKNKGCIIGVVKDRTHASSERERVFLSLSLECACGGGLSLPSRVIQDLLRVC